MKLAPAALPRYSRSHTSSCNFASILRLTRVIGPFLYASGVRWRRGIHPDVQLKGSFPILEEVTTYARMEHVRPFVVVVHLIHRTKRSDISCTTRDNLFFNIRYKLNTSPLEEVHSNAVSLTHPVNRSFSRSMIFFPLRCCFCTSSSPLSSLLS